MHDRPQSTVLIRERYGLRETQAEAIVGFPLK